jgi:cell division protein FtsA
MRQPSQNQSLQSAAPIGVLDAGSGKIVCLVTDQTASGPRVLGLGLQRSRGIKSGVIVDLNEADLVIRAAIAEAEKAAGVTLNAIYAQVSCGRLKSLAFAANADILGPSVCKQDIIRLMQGARAYAERDGRMALHLNRTAVELDGAASSLEPVGMAAHMLRANVHAVTADSAPVRNLMLVLERCHLPIAGLYAAPLASALAATTADERQNGVTVIDIGFGTAKLATFAGGHLVHVALIPQGGQLMTADIAQALHTPLKEAERIKTIYGSLISAQSDQHETFSYPDAGRDGRMQQATRAQLGHLLRTRFSDLLTTLMARAEPFQAGSSIVLTGGAAQMAGVAEFAGTVLQRSVRVGLLQSSEGVSREAGIQGLLDTLSTPGLMTAVGVSIAAHGGFRDQAAAKPAPETGSYVRRVGEWLKSSF